jgi:hypothetical protein
MREPPSPTEQLTFIRGVQRLLGQGSFVASYKFALLHAIADLCVSHGEDDGGELTLDVTQIAEEMVEIYWRQALPYPAGERSAVLRQNTGAQAEILTLLERTRMAGSRSLGKLRTDRIAWRALVRVVARTVKRMPLWRLQIFAGAEHEFLYENNPGADAIVLKPGVAFCFRRYYDLVIELVRAGWLRFVRTQNLSLLGEAADLSSFLFGSDRQSLATFRPILYPLQQGLCFYCDGKLGDRMAVDHFIPWARYPNDLGHNFVLAHESCNGRKADWLAAEPHLERWLERDQQHGATLGDMFGASGILADQLASRRVAQWAYREAADLGSQVWLRERTLVALEPTWTQLF